MSTVLQILLWLGVLTPLASFVALVFFGRRLPDGQALLQRAVGGMRVRARHFEPAGHAEHGPQGSIGAGEPLAGWIATAACGLACVFSLFALLAWTNGEAADRVAWTKEAAVAATNWLSVGGVPIELGIRLDSLTVIVFFMITLCATCIHVFSLGYMRGEAGFTRFFAFLSLFLFSMLGLVVSSNLLLTFVFWELVGVCSYFLIGFWFEKKSASNAAIKAFVVNRVGDFGFLIGLSLALAFLGTLSLNSLPAAFESGAAQAGLISEATGETGHKVAAATSARAAMLFNLKILGVSLATWMGLGLFCGALGKSAQFPLHVWLPDAMEGPTPVSALIHAATMVAAGVYMLARVYPLLTPEALFVITIIGAITLTIAAFMALVQYDIKRVLAYSTLSQLGYMVFGLGVGAWTGALFHLLTHAFFKALLFLGSGQVIAACHHEQDMRRMGGLFSKLPKTASCFLLAVLAISGAGIPWLGPGLGGYYSKDEILAVAMARMHTAIGGWELPVALFALPILVAWLTPLYMGRCFVLTFLGKPRDHHIHEHAHESPIMFRPLMALGFMTFISGIPVFFFRSLVAAAAPEHLALTSVIDGRESHDENMHHVHQTLPLLIGFAWVVSLGLAYWLYAGGLARSEKIRNARPIAGLVRIIENKFYFDAIYGFLFVQGAKALAVAARLFDEWVVDAIANNLAYMTARVARFSGVVLDLGGVDGAVNAVGDGFQGAGRVFSRVQTGRVRNYILMGAGAVAACIVCIAAGIGWKSWATIFVILAALVAVPWSDLRKRLAGEVTR